MTGHSSVPRSLHASYTKLFAVVSACVLLSWTSVSYGSQFFSPELCCGDVPLKMDDHSRCCGNLSYSALDSMCCWEANHGHYTLSFSTPLPTAIPENAVGPITRPRANAHNAARFLTCCGDQLYDFRFFTCCDGIVRKQALSGNTGCCGRHSYDPYVQLCCNGNILQKATFSSFCCGERSYDNTKEVCCGDRVFPAGSNTSLPLSCCASSTYSTETQLCCGRVRLDKATSTSYCCGGNQFDWETELCCNGQVHSKMSETEFCCGQNSYDSTTHLCCLDTIIPKKKVSNRHLRLSSVTSASKRFDILSSSDDEGIQCCGNTTYNYDREICCDGVVTTTDVAAAAAAGKSSAPSTRCCGKQPYDENTQICCEGQVSPKATRAEDCCGPRVFNVQNQVCCQGVIHDLKPDSLLYCCGSSTFNPLMETCCNGKKTAKEVLSNEA